MTVRCLSLLLLLLLLIMGVAMVTSAPVFSAPHSTAGCGFWECRLCLTATFVHHAGAIEVLNEHVIPELLGGGKMDQAGKWTAEIAAMHEEDSNDTAALEAYTRAADLYSSADSASVCERGLALVAECCWHRDPR